MKCNATASVTYRKRNYNLVNHAHNLKKKCVNVIQHLTLLTGCYTCMCNICLTNTQPSKFYVQNNLFNSVIFNIKLHTGENRSNITMRYFT